MTTNSLVSDILEMLDDDMVSHGFLLRCIEQSEKRTQSPFDQERDLLTALLASGQVEIGTAQLRNPDYVEFIAWKGSVDERVRRAMESAAQRVGHDQEFAYWLCLRTNIDRFESEG